MSKQMMMVMDMRRQIFTCTLLVPSSGLATVPNCVPITFLLYLSVATQRPNCIQRVQSHLNETDASASRGKCEKSLNHSRIALNSLYLRFSVGLVLRLPERDSIRRTHGLKHEISRCLSAVAREEPRPRERAHLRAPPLELTARCTTKKQAAIRRVSASAKAFMYGCTYNGNC
jgi:hypothetical protein